MPFGSTSVMPSSIIRRLFLPSLVVAALAAPAIAQPSAPPPAPPQNVAWNEVSHINGQLVKVGETNDYLYKYRRTNISTNPLGWIFGIYGVSASYGMSDHFALRGDVNFFHDAFDDNGANGFERGIGVPLYLKRTYQGAFLEPGFIVRGFEHEDYSSSYASPTMRTDVTFGPQVLIGWHWTWDGGFNVAAA